MRDRRSPPPTRGSDVRDDPGVEAGEQQLDHLDARAGVALRERVRPQEHRRAHDLVRVRVADAAGVAAQEAQLELPRQLLRDRLRDETAEPGVHPVRVLARAVRGPVDELARRDHPLPRGVGEPGVATLDRDGPDVLDRQVFARQHMQAHGVRV